MFFNNNKFTKINKNTIKNFSPVKNHYPIINNPIVKIVINHIKNYPTPIIINYGWSFGFLSGVFFAFQILSGIFLAMHYNANIGLAFWSIEHILRDVNFGFFLKYMHANGASMVFIVLYIHIAKAIYFKSYKYGNGRIFLFYTGIIIFLLMMGTAFIGYILPWGQMSLWGATVITNLLTAIPYIGENLAQWIWGGFSVGNPTLNRFFSLHYLFPFLTLAIILVHLTLLHIRGSTTPIGLLSNKDTINFYPFFYIKDFLSLMFFLLFYCILINYYPNLLGHSDNYIISNPLVTPTHIVPEWYFLPFYAILRAIPNKIGGVIAMLISILILFILPLIDKVNLKSPRYGKIFKINYLIFIGNFIFLGYLGGCPVDYPYVLLSRIATIIYFFFFLVNIPMYWVIEKKKN
jgi:ubiquinol-cytochrome c reductase cytochrome b/c1 subunit